MWSCRNISTSCSFHTPAAATYPSPSRSSCTRSSNTSVSTKRKPSAITGDGTAGSGPSPSRRGPSVSTRNRDLLYARARLQHHPPRHARREAQLLPRESDHTRARRSTGGLALEQLPLLRTRRPEHPAHGLGWALAHHLVRALRVSHGESNPEPRYKGPGGPPSVKVGSRFPPILEPRPKTVKSRAQVQRTWATHRTLIPSP
jgi:hypothetical protein